MTDANLSTGTTALTNALKQVFYIHKDVVAELRVKLDSLKKENDELRQKQACDNQNGSGPCMSCKHLKELNKTLQENFNSRLRDKNAIIKHLEERLKNLSGNVDTQVDTEKISTLETSPVASEIDEMCKTESFANEVKHSSTSPEDSYGKSGKHLSKLRLPKESQRRRRYVEQEDRSNSKRRKLSPNSTQISHENHSDDIHDKTPGIESRGRRKSDLNNYDEELPSVNVLVPETENFTCFGETGKNGRPSLLNGKDKNWVDEERSPNLLIIPETLGMGDCSGEDNDSELDSSLKEITQKQEGDKCNEMETLTEDTLKNLSPQENDISNRSKPCLKKRSTYLKRSFSSKSKMDNQELRDGIKEGNKEMVNSRDNLLDVKNTSNDVSTTSPMSPGIFEELARPFSKCETPKSVKTAETGGANLKKNILNSTTSLKEAREYSHRQKVAVDNSENNCRLLRQITLSQSFSNKAKTGTRKDKSKTSKTDYCRIEEAALQEAMRQSLLEAETKETVLSRLGDKTKCETSPFKVPLSPRNRKSPRVKAKNSSGNELHNEEPCYGNEKVDKTSPKRIVSSSNFDDDVFSLSPVTRSKMSPREKLRTSPRLHSSQGRCVESPRGDLAKKALFVDCKNGSPGKRTTKSSREKKSGDDVLLVTTSQSKQNGIVGDNVLKKKRTEDPDSQDLNASLDPDMRLSMYLNSEDSAPVTQVPRKGRAEDRLVPSQTFAAMDMDETVAPNLMTLDDTLGQADPIAKRGEMCKNARKVGDDGHRKILRRIDDSLLGVGHNEQGDDDDVDEDDESEDNGEETIAPSPQQQSLKFPSQSLSSTGIPSTSCSFKFITKVKHSSVPTGTDSQTSMRMDKPSGKADNFCVDAENLDLSKGKDNDEDDFKDVNDVKLENVPQGQGQHTSKPFASLYDSFDIVPQKPAEYAHVQVVRKKSERSKLQGFSCKQCFDYYKDMNLSEKELQQRMRDCSRHKEKYRPPSTPEHFWSLSIRDTAEDHEGEEKPEVVRLRRRKRLEKKFKSKGEEEGEL